jgi:putative transposase
MSLRRTSHAVYDTSYHLVWCPKYRKKLFDPLELRKRAEQLIREISEEYGFEIEQMEIARDHVHILLSFPPKYSIGNVVRTIKSKSAIGLFREFPQIKRRLWAGQLWEDGYFARTVGNRMTQETIEQYIKHHREIEQGPAQLKFKLR